MQLRGDTPTTEPQNSEMVLDVAGTAMGVGEGVGGGCCCPGRVYGKKETRAAQTLKAGTPRRVRGERKGLSYAACFFF